MYFCLFCNFKINKFVNNPLLVIFLGSTNIWRDYLNIRNSVYVVSLVRFIIVTSLLWVLPIIDLEY